MQVVERRVFPTRDWHYAVIKREKCRIWNRTDFVHMQAWLLLTSGEWVLRAACRRSVSLCISAPVLPARQRASRLDGGEVQAGGTKPCGVCVWILKRAGLVG